MAFGHSCKALWGRQMSAYADAAARRRRRKFNFRLSDSSPSVSSHGGRRKFGPSNPYHFRAQGPRVREILGGLWPRQQDAWGHQKTSKSWPQNTRLWVSSQEGRRNHGRSNLDPPRAKVAELRCQTRGRRSLQRDAPGHLRLAYMGDASRRGGHVLKRCPV